MTQIGGYAPGELEYLIAHNNTVLLEIDDMAFNYTVPKAPGGSGLGRLQNRYIKRIGPPEGTFSFNRSWLQNSDEGQLFQKLLMGAGVVITEAIASAATTYTPTQSLVSVLEMKLAGGTVLEETDDYTVNWATGIITFNAALTEAAEIVYVTDDSDWIGQNLIQNTGIEDFITNLWTAVATGTVTRTTTAADVYVGDASLDVVTAAQNDGAQYDPDISVVPNRVYRFSYWAKGAAADDCVANWTDAGGTVAMTAVLTAAVLSLEPTWKLHEWTFTPDEATILNLQVLNSDAAAGAGFQIDEVFLRENAPRLDIMRSGLYFGFGFEIIARRTLDGVVIARLRDCQVFDGGISSGERYSEAVNGQFLRLDILEV